MCVFGWLRLVEKIEKIVLKIEKCYTPFKNINSWLSCDTYLYVCSFWSTKWPREHAVDWYKSDTGTECDNKELKFDIDEKKKIPQEFSFKLSFFLFLFPSQTPFSSFVQSYICC